MKDKTKIFAVCAGLIAICVLLVAAISRMLYQAPTEPEVVIDTEVQESVAVEPIEVQVVVPEVTVDEIQEAINSGAATQQIQEEPEKPEVPTEAPELAEDQDIHNPNKIPEYQEPEEEPEDQSPVVTNPSDGGGHPGQIYVDGFGWVDDNGPGSQSIDAPDIYMNGNTVGDM